MPSSADVVIIGGGVIGVCTAYYLAEQGARVTLVEQGQIAAGSSYGNAGLIVPSHSIPLASPGALASGLKWMLDPESPFYIKPRLDFALVDWVLRFALACTPGRMRQSIPVLRDLGRASSALHKELAALDGAGANTGYAQTGLLMLYNTARGLQDGCEEARLLQEFGVTSEVLDGGQARKLEPSLSPETVGGIFFPGDAHFTPGNFMRGLARQVEQKGVRLQTETQVLGFETAARRVTLVHTTHGDIEPGQVVLAAGSWSPSVARELGFKIPIQAAKGYSITVKRPAASPTIPLLLGEARVAVTPMVSADGPVLRLAGTLELAGFDFSVNPRRVNAILRAARGYLGGMEDLELVEIWRGLRPCTPDGLPIIGRPPSLENVIVAAGHATVGMSLGPITGKLVAQLVSGETPALDLAPLRPDRF